MNCPKCGYQEDPFRPKSQIEKFEKTEILSRKENESYFWKGLWFYIKEIFTLKSLKLFLQNLGLLLIVITFPISMPIIIISMGILTCISDGIKQCNKKGKYLTEKNEQSI